MIRLEPIIRIFQYPTSEKANLRSDARIRVNLIDVNNKRPDFLGFDENGKYPAAVSEEADPYSEPVIVGQVFAVDSDGTFPNNNVRFQVCSKKKEKKPINSCGPNH